MLQMRTLQLEKAKEEMLSLVVRLQNLNNNHFLAAILALDGSKVEESSDSLRCLLSTEDESQVPEESTAPSNYECDDPWPNLGCQGRAKSEGCG
jgi:hypothetical protein